MFRTEPYYGGEDARREDYVSEPDPATRRRFRGFNIQINDATPKHAYYAAYKTGHAVKIVCYALFVLLLVLIAVQLLELIPKVGIQWTKLVHGDKFTQKENLQWLGASANVIRGDYENKTDSLAEKAAKQASAVTDMTTPLPVKAGFLSREKYVSPEEELSKKQRM